MATASGTRAVTKALKPATSRRPRQARPGTWLPGIAAGAGGARRYRLFRPPGVKSGERLPLMVMLHGCGQEAISFAACTRMNRIAMRERFLVLYPEQDGLASPHGCWNWFDTDTGRAYAEAASIVTSVQQVCLLHPVDKARLAIAGLSAGASMAALVASRHPGLFKAVVMHSGIAPGTAHSAVSALRAMHGHRAAKPLVPAPRARSIDLPPLLVIHGDADGVVSPRNAQAAAKWWARAAGARAGEPREVRRGKRYPLSVTEFARDGRTLVTLVAVDRLAHAWSGGADGKPFSDRQGPDASRMAWTFAARQFRTQD